MKYFNTITQITVGTHNENPIFGDCIRVKLEDECGGMFLVLEQDGEDDSTNQVRIAFEEWESIQDAIDTLMNQPLVK